MTQHPVLVVGAAGMLGSAIADELLRDGGFAVRALVRRKRPEMQGLEQIEGDITDAATLPRAVEGVHSIISAVNNQPEQSSTARQTCFEPRKRQACGASSHLISPWITASATTATTTTST